MSGDDIKLTALELNNDPSLNQLYSSKALTSEQSSILKRTLEFGSSVLLRSAGFSVPSKGFGLNTGGVENQRELFELQRQLQREMQQFTLISNMAKSRHEARMAAVRNMKP